MNSIPFRDIYSLAWRLCLAAVMLTSAAGRVSAKEISGQVGEANVAASYNSLGLRAAGKYGYQWRLYEHKHAAFSDNYLRLQVLIDASPATITVGQTLKFQPASFINVGITHSNRIYLPAFSNGAFYTADKEKDVRDRFSAVNDFLEGEDLVYTLIDESEAEIGKRELYYAHLLLAYATLQLKVGPVFMVVLGEMTRFWAGLPGPNTHYYEPVLDLFIQDNDLFVEVTGILGYEWGPVSWVVVSSNLIALRADMRDILLGPGALWTITEQWGALIKPSLLFFSRWHLDHLWRTKSPYLPALGLIVKADF